MKYSALDLGTIEAVVNKLGGMEGVHRFLCGELKLEITQCPVWKTVRRGVHKNLGSITTMLTKFKVTDWVKDIIGKPAFTLAQTEEDLSLCVATVKKLTGKNEATTKEIFDVIKLAGDLCPAEVGPALREQYLDQPNGEWLHLAMKPIRDCDGRLTLFGVGRGHGELWLRAHCADPEYVWGGNSFFVYRARK